MYLFYFRAAMLQIRFTKQRGPISRVSRNRIDSCLSSPNVHQFDLLSKLYHWHAQWAML